MWRLLLPALCFATALEAQTQDVHTAFRTLFIRTTCQLEHPSFQPGYADCHRAPDLILAHMDRVFMLRGSCPHPLMYPSLVQMAFDCSEVVRAAEDGRAEDVGACFAQRFKSAYDPASVHYCDEIERGDNDGS